MSSLRQYFKIALIQMKIGSDKSENLKRAVNLICEAKQNGSNMVVLPECFNSPYGTNYFPNYAEEIPCGETSVTLSKAAKDNEVYLIGGSIPEIENKKLYNTSTVWDPKGALICKHRKVHLFDIDIPRGIRFKESDTLTAGSSLTIFNTEYCKVGLGICYDLRFHEMACIYRNSGADVIIYPGAFNMITGPLHWELLLRSRAVDNQVFVAGVCGAQDPDANYKVWGHSMLVNPWGKILTQAKFEPTILYSEIDLKVCYEIRQQIPISCQKRYDLYDIVSKIDL